jgi:hypothetical protein
VHYTGRFDTRLHYIGPLPIYNRCHNSLSARDFPSYSDGNMQEIAILTKESAVSTPRVSRLHTVRLTSRELLENDYMPALDIRYLFNN